MDLRRKQPIGVELVRRGIVTENNIESALQYQRQHSDMKLGDILYELDVCDPTILINEIADIVGAKGILLTNSMVKINMTDYIPKDIAKKNKAVAFDIQNGRIKVCFPNNIESRKMEEIRVLVLKKGLIMDTYVTFTQQIDKILSLLDGAMTDEIDNSEDTSTTRLVDSIIRTAIESRASDIHIEPMQHGIRVRYRIDGELYTATTVRPDKQQQVIGRLKAISNMHQEKQESQDGRITSYEDYNIRVSSQPNIYGEKFVLRLLKKNTDVRSIFELGYPGDDENVRKSFNKKNSITIIAAPTGEGKTTTLYSIIDYLNRPEINITTIEDPVEIRIDGLNQIEIGPKATFSNSLRTVLRQDPDVILVGEIRDLETAEIAIQAGQTGHYVLSTIHTIDSIEVINRLRKMGVSDYDIGSILATSVSERLIRKGCPKCRKERPFSDEEKELITKIMNRYGEEVDFTGKKTFDAVGCDYCNNTGFYERIGIFEILDVSDAIRELIVKGASNIEIRNKALELGYRPLIVDGLNKVLAGITTLDELNRKIVMY